MRLSAGFSASSGMIQVDPAFWTPFILFSSQRIATLRADIFHFSAACDVDKYIMHILAASGQHS
jgi:hypothetical protein